MNKPTTRQRNWKPLALGMSAMAAIAALAGGCVLEPADAAAERVRLAQAGAAWQEPLARRDLPDLPAEPTWHDVLERTFLANGELEAAWHEWAMAVERIESASAWPNTNVMVGFDYMFSRERMKAWDRTTLSVGVDPAMMLQWPGKAAQAGKVALEQARVRGARLEAVKFDLQRKVLSAYFDYALQAERIRIQQANVELLDTSVQSAAQRVRAGAAQEQLLQLQIESELAGNQLANMQAELAARRRLLNGVLARPPDAPLPPPERLPPPRPLPAADDLLIALGVDRNPELAGLAHEVAGRGEALELARLAYIPDFAPQVSITGNISQAIGLMVSLPTTLVQIRSSIRQAAASLNAAEAMARQTRSDRAAEFVATLLLLRNYERQTALVQDDICPRADQLVANTVRAYAAGRASYLELIEAQRLQLEVRLLAAESHIAREKKLVELEALAGVDVETLAGAAAPAPVPSARKDCDAHE